MSPAPIHNPKQAYSQGYKAGLNGISRGNVPYSNGEMQRAWEAGWDAGEWERYRKKQKKGKRRKA